MSTSSWLPCIDGVSERCTWQIDITVPKRIRNIFPQTPVAPKRSPHRTRSMAIHNGDMLPREEPEKTPASNFSQEELDMEMIVVSAGEFVKEVCGVHRFVLIVDHDEEFTYQDRDICYSTTRWQLPACLCCWSILKDEFIGPKRIRRGGPEQYTGCSRYFWILSSRKRSRTTKLQSLHVKSISLLPYKSLLIARQWIILYENTVHFPTRHSNSVS
jgi:hypothetical protein